MLQYDRAKGGLGPGTHPIGGDLRRLHLAGHLFFRSVYYTGVFVCRVCREEASPFLKHGNAKESKRAVHVHP